MSNDNQLMEGYILQDSVGSRLFKALNAKGQGHVAVKRWGVNDSNGNNEISILQKLYHPVIPRFISECYYNGNLYMAEEWIEGITLHDFIIKNGKLGKEKLIDVVLQLVDFLEYLHNHDDGPFCFIDLKPQNILIDQNLMVHVVDYESTQKIDDFSKFYDECTTVPLGTELYTAPEILSGIVTTSNDIYSLGGVMYFMNTGLAPRKPFKVSNEFASIISKCMNMDVQLRYKTVSEVKLDLLSLLKTTFIKERIVPTPILHSFRKRIILVEGNLCFASELAYSASKLCNLKTVIFEMNEGLSNRTSYFLDTIGAKTPLVSEESTFYTKQAGTHFLSKDSSEWVSRGILQRVKDVDFLDVGAFDIFDEFQINDSNEIRMFADWAYNNYDLVIIASEMAVTSNRKAQLMKLCDCIIAAPNSNVDDLEFYKNYFSRLESVLGIPENKFRIAAWDYRKNSSIPENGIVIMIGNSKFLGAISYDEDRMLCRNRKGSYFCQGMFVKMAEDYEKILSRFNYVIKSDSRKQIN